MPNGEDCFNVSATMPEHGKIEAVGGDAGWLFICILGYCKRSKKGGVFPLSKVSQVSDRRQPMKLFARMVDEHLVHEPGHDCKKCPQPMPRFGVVHDWPYWQGGDEADEAARREAKGHGGSYGNHRRWHAGRGVTDTSCEFCASHMRSDNRSVEGSLMRSDSDGITDRGPNRISDGSDNGTLFPPQTPPNTRVDITPPTPQAAANGKRSRRQAYDYASDLQFLRFWDAFPVKSGKPAAFKAWLAALARGADPELIIARAVAYRDDPNRNPDKTKYPQGWLNDERYLDESPTGAKRERNYDF